MKLITMRPTNPTDHDELDGDQWFAVLENEHDRDMLRLVMECNEIGDNLCSERVDRDAGDFYYGKACGILTALCGADYGEIYSFLDAEDEGCPEVGGMFTRDGINFKRVK